MRRRFFAEASLPMWKLPRDTTAKVIDNRFATFGRAGQAPKGVKVGTSWLVIDGSGMPGARADIAYMIDQSHNLKGKMEAMLQTVMTAQELYAKAALVDHESIARHQKSCDLVDAENCLKDAFSTDVRPAIAEWRRSHGLAEDPLAAFRSSGYLERITADRAEKDQGCRPGATYA